MKKNKFITSTIILAIGNIIAKIINMLIRISISRNIGTTGMGVYMLVVPTFSLFIALASMGLPVAISKLVSENKKNNKKIMINATTTIMLFNIFLLLILVILAHFISFHLLKDSRTYKAIISIALVLPFISISSILRGYFFGKEKVIPQVTSNIVEDVIRMIIIIVGLPISYNYGLDYAISFDLKTLKLKKKTLRLIKVLLKIFLELEFQLQVLD